MQTKIEVGLVNGVLNLETGRVRKWRNNRMRQRGVEGERISQSKRELVDKLY